MLLITTTAINLAACGSSKTPASADNDGTSASKDTAASVNASQVVIKYLVTHPSVDMQAEGAPKLGELIEECSDGRMKMEFYLSSQLGDKTVAFEGLEDGITEMTGRAATDLPALNDMWSVFSLPYLWENRQQACTIVMDPTVREVLEADAQANGFIIIVWTDVGGRSMTNRKRTANTPAGLTGLKIRCVQDSILTDLISTMGAIAAPLDVNEIYTGLQQGIIGGLNHVPSVVVANGWQELAKYFSPTEYPTIPDPIFVSKVWSGGLFAESQEAALEAGKRFPGIWNNETWPEVTEDGMEAVKEQGAEAVEVSKTLFEEVVKPVIDKFLAGASEDQKAPYDLLAKTRGNYQQGEIHHV